MKFIRNKNQLDSEENIELLRIEYSRQLWKSMFFSLATVVVVAIASIAWFVSNSKVNSSVASVSAGFDPIKLATRGHRQQAEIDNLKHGDGDLYEYAGKTYYYTKGGAIALRLSGDNNEVSPGSKGMVEFYIIPGGGASSVTLQIGLGGYGADESDENTVKPINNSVLNALMSGHILMFDNYDDNGVYSDWLFQDNNSSIFNNAITIDLSGRPEGVPVPVNLYWIWPLRYENMANDFNDDRVKNFIIEQAGAEAMTDLNENYRYSRIFLTNQSELIDDVARSKAYDLADEYIGSNAQFLYVTIQTSASVDMEGGQQ